MQMSKSQFELRDGLPAGTRVGGYVVETLLGYGGYSVVYRARHAELGSVVALKEYMPADLSVREFGTIHPRSSESIPYYEDGKRRFLEEAKQIVHFKDILGVIDCLDFFRANGTAYIVMEYVEGMSFAELLSQRESSGNPLDENELRAIVVPLLKTLSQLHEADVLHRDIKPSNILLRQRNGTPILIDFGAAKQYAAIHSKSVAPFTEGYAALEQVGEGELGTWTDLYAIGAVMWRVVAGGNPPWNPPNPKKVEFRASAMLAGKRDPMPAAVELGKDRFSQPLLVAIDKCLRIKKAERIPSCETLLSVIEIDKPTPDLTNLASIDESNTVNITKPKNVNKAKSSVSEKINKSVSFFARFMTGFTALMTGLIISFIVAVESTAGVLSLLPIVVGLAVLIYVILFREGSFVIGLVFVFSCLTKLWGFLVFSLGVFLAGGKWLGFLPDIPHLAYMIAISIGAGFFKISRIIFNEVQELKQ